MDNILNVRSVTYYTNTACKNGFTEKDLEVFMVQKLNIILCCCKWDGSANTQFVKGKKLSCMYLSRIFIKNKYSHRILCQISSISIKMRLSCGQSGRNKKNQKDNMTCEKGRRRENQERVKEYYDKFLSTLTAAAKTVV